jgi:hypothetical protein
MKLCNVLNIVSPRLIIWEQTKNNKNRQGTLKMDAAGLQTITGFE